MSAIDAVHFRKVLGHFPTGVTVVAATTADGPVGFAVGSFFSVSLDPALVGFCAARTSSSWRRIRDAGAFCVNILGEEHDELCRQFATPMGDRFDGVSWDATDTGSPRLADAVAWIDCSIAAVHPAGDHDICIGEVQQLDVVDDSKPLLFCRGGYGGFSPASVPASG